MDAGQTGSSNDRADLHSGPDTLSYPVKRFVEEILKNYLFFVRGIQLLSLFYRTSVR